MTCDSASRLRDMITYANGLEDGQLYADICGTAKSPAPDPLRGRQIVRDVLARCWEDACDVYFAAREETSDVVQIAAAVAMILVDAEVVGEVPLAPLAVLAVRHELASALADPTSVADILT